jgi:hypothetical protein
METKKICEGVWAGGRPCTKEVSSLVTVPQLKKDPYWLCSLCSCALRNAMHTIGVKVIEVSYDIDGQGNLLTFIK